MAMTSATKNHSTAGRWAAPILLAASVLGLIVIQGPLSAQAATCTPAQVFDSHCVSGTTQPDDVILEGRTTTTEEVEDASADDASPSEDAASTGPCAAAACHGPARDQFGVTAPLTLADIAHFRPDPGVDNMEPNGWTVFGLDTNFYATGDTQIKDGILLGQSASVRFTPVRWAWAYGDGTSAIRSTPGSTWAAQGIHEFDPTPTSHIYRARGTYVIDLSISYSPEYRYAGGPWVPIAGTITLPANRLTITVGNAKTVLVENDCNANPTGPGC